MDYSSEQLRRLQLVLAEIAKDIDRICRENGIEYFLDSGSCLGAVRHAGFIPWDDDMDLGMRRADYDRFLEIASAALGNSYVVAHPGNEPRLAGQFCKVWRRDTLFETQETVEAGLRQGIFVDVFPYDRLCDDPQAAEKQLKDCRMWQSLSYLYHAKSINVPDGGLKGTVERAGCKVVHSIVHAALDPACIRDRFEQAARQGGKGDGGEYANPCYVQGGRFPEDMLFPTSTVSFEGVELSAPAKPEAYLALMYGDDWGELPPVEERRNHAPLRLEFGE